MQQQKLSQAELDLISKFKLIGTQTRYKILKTVHKSSEHLNISAISHKLQKTNALISQNVKALEKANLVVATYESIEDKHGVSKFIQINEEDSVINFLLSYLEIDD